MAERIRVIPRQDGQHEDRPWTRHYDPGVPASLEYPDVPLHALLEDAARSYTDATGTIFLGARRTYRSLQRDATFFSAGLRALGVRQGDRVALVLPNCPQFVIAFFATLRLGAVAVPVDPLFTPHELQQRLADCGAEVVVALSRAYPAVAAARAGTAVRHVVVTGIADEMPPLLRLAFRLTRERQEGHRVQWRGDAGTVAFRDLLVDAGEPVAAPVSPDDLAVLQYTGGTTGVPKGAMLSHRALLANTLQCRAWFTGLADGRDTVMAVMPYFHVYGLTVALLLPVQAAAAIVLEPRFDLARVLADIERYRPKVLPGAPRLYAAIAGAPDAARRDLRSIEACISGSAPLPAETARRFEELTGGRVAEGYGLTEAAPVTHCNPFFGTRKPGSVGVPLPDVEARVVDLETGERVLAPGEAGELVVRGPNLMDGYHGHAGETAEALRGGWLRTGDIATIDRDGYAFIVDRKKELIIVSGENVYPREVEEALDAHPAVAESAVIGIPHPEKGEVVKAFVVVRAGAAVGADELVTFSRGRLAPYKVPREIELRDALPKTVIGKVLRRQLADEERARRAGP